MSSLLLFDLLLQIVGDLVCFLYPVEGIMKGDMLENTSPQDPRYRIREFVMQCFGFVLPTSDLSGLHFNMILQVLLLSLQLRHLLL